MNSTIRNELDYEILILADSIAMLREMHNRVMITVSGDDYKEVRFIDTHRQKLYFIYLTDFLSQTKLKRNKKKENLIDSLLSISLNPQLGTKKSTRFLRTKTRSLLKWLAFEPKITKIWLPEIERNVTLKISRGEMINLCGNFSKHRLSNLSWNILAIQELFRKNGLQITEGDAASCYKTLYEWFHDNFLIAHTTFLAQQLIDIEWAIYFYLKPVHDKVIEYYDHPLLGRKGYRFEAPKKWELINNSSINHFFYEILNWARGGGPIFHSFKIREYWKIKKF